MIRIIFLFIFMLIGADAFAQESELDAMSKFFSEYGWIPYLLIFVFEYLVGISKLKSNSTIEMVINFLSMFIPAKFKK